MITVDQRFYDALLQAGQQLLEHCVAKGEEEMASQILAGYGGKLHVVTVAGDWDEHLAAVQHLLDKKTPIDVISHTVDAYGIKTDYAYGYGSKAMGDGAGLIPGTLSKRFEAGDPRVTECINLTVVSLDETYFTTLPYRRKGRTVVWKPDARAQHRGGDVSGKYAALFRQVITMSQQS